MARKINAKALPGRRIPLQSGQMLVETASWARVPMGRASAMKAVSTIQLLTLVHVSQTEGAYLRSEQVLRLDEQLYPRCLAARVKQLVTILRGHLFPFR